MNLKDALTRSGIPPLDAEVLMAHVLQKPRSWLFAHENTDIGEEEAKNFDALAHRRKTGEPIAYILNQKEFYGRTFIVNRDVLIPRPATEELTRVALDFMKKPRFIEKEIDAGISALCVPLSDDKPEAILDIGTGSGCIAATLALEGRTEQIIAIDVSDTALDVAQENFRMLSPNVVAVHGDGTAFIQAMKKPFFIISNPPYIPEGTSLQRDVADFEPHEALFSGPNGTNVLVNIARAAADNPACLGVVLELRTDQTPVVKRLLGAL